MWWPTTMRRRLERHHAEVEAARAETRETFHQLADVTMKLLETTDRLKEALNSRGEVFDE